MIKGVLLDVDGTLVLSNDAHAESWAKAFKKFGYDIEFRAVRSLIGMGSDKLLPKLVPGLDYNSNKAQKMREFRSQLFLEEYAPSLKPTPGSRELILRLKENKLKLIVASSASQNELSTLLKAAKVDDLLTEATTSDQADESKPDPDIIHAALTKLGLLPEQTVMLGDTPYDIEAAGRAGVQLIAVRCGGWKDEDLTGAIAIYDDPADIATHYDTSPFTK